MKKKIQLSITLLTLMGGVILMNSCRKDSDDLFDFTSQNVEQSQDAQNINSTLEEIDENIDNVASETGLKSTMATLPCNVAIDSSIIVNKKMTLTFNGDNCYGTRNRQGIVVVELTSGAHWNDPGSVITVTYQNLKITDIASGKYIILNGSKTHTNVSGGLAPNLGFGDIPDTIVRKIESGNMKITFTNNNQRTWNITMIRKYTKPAGNLVVVTSGFGESYSHSNLIAWGVNRNGSQFYTEIKEPIVYSEECEYKPLSGLITHYVGTRDMTVTLGTDASGNPVNEGCAEYFKVNWTSNSGARRTEIIQYQ